MVLDNKAEFIKKVKLVISNHNKRPIMALETGRTIILFSFLPAAVTYGQRQFNLFGYILGKEKRSGMFQKSFRHWLL